MKQQGKKEKYLFQTVKQFEKIQQNNIILNFIIYILLLIFIRMEEFFSNEKIEYSFTSLGITLLNMIVLGSIIYFLYFHFNKLKEGIFYFHSWKVKKLTYLTVISCFSLFFQFLFFMEMNIKENSILKISIKEVIWNFLEIIHIIIYLLVLTSPGKFFKENMI